MKFDIQEKQKSIIKVVGVGGGGGNAVGHMFTQGIVGVDFAVCNTDIQAIENNPVPVKISLGPNLTEGRGAGSKPEVGKEACIESIDDVKNFLQDGTKMLFVTAGMGGGTGTGAAPIISKAAKELGILTVAIVTIPFSFEGLRRKKYALEGLENLKKNVDAILVISNDKLREMFGNLVLSDAFAHADDVLTTAAKAIAEIITKPGKINVDFADVHHVMKDSGVALMGVGIAEGEERARKAVNMALNSPLLEENDIRGAKHILLNITSGTKEMTMDEIGEITDFVQEEAGYGTDLIFGTCIDESIGDKISITVIATGFESNAEKKKVRKEVVTKVPLEDDFELITEEPSMHTTDSSKGQTIEFEDEDVAKTYEKLGFMTVMPTDPYQAKKEQQEKAREARMEDQRRQSLRNTVTKPLVNPEALEESENTPAYMRRGVMLDDEDSATATKEVTGAPVFVDEEGTIMKSGNSFLTEYAD